MKHKKNKITITVIVVAIVMIFIGIYNNEARQILNNAKYICLSCIGIG